jgi:hypothetical protein
MDNDVHHPAPAVWTAAAAAGAIPVRLRAASALLAHPHRARRVEESVLIAEFTERLVHRHAERRHLGRQDGAGFRQGEAGRP